MSTLTISHHINEHIGAYWYTLKGVLKDSEGNEVTVCEGTSKLSKVKKAIEFYKTNGFHWFEVKHLISVDNFGEKEAK